jgi:hypothetical protein
VELRVRARACANDAQQRRGTIRSKNPLTKSRSKNPLTAQRWKVERGVKLKTKYNAPSDIKREKSKSNSPDSGEKNKKRRKIKIETGKVSQAKLKSVKKKILK